MVKRLKTENKENNSASRQVSTSCNIVKPTYEMLTKKTKNPKYIPQIKYR